VSPRQRQPERTPVLVSACLLGLPTRYDGSHCRREEVERLAEGCLLVPVCPEQLGGLPTPREPAEINRGDGQDVLEARSAVTARPGDDVTVQFLRGAEAVAQVAGVLNVRRAILKEGSPSCGVARIRRNGQEAPGMGVTTALLLRKGLQVDGID
jgi:uncharacterized protein YbbK (DUF523 family)